MRIEAPRLLAGLRASILTRPEDPSRATNGRCSSSPRIQEMFGILGPWRYRSRDRHHGRPDLVARPNVRWSGRVPAVGCTATPRTVIAARAAQLGR